MRSSIRLGLGLLVLYLVAILLYIPPVYESPLPENPLAHYRFSDLPFNEAEIAAVLPELKEQYGQNKTVPPEYELSFYAALTFYPALRTARITAQSSNKIATSMQAKPANLSLLWWKRHYCVDINDQSAKTVNLSEANFTELTGCFIHELAHVQYYETKRNGSIILTGIRYLSSQSFKSRLEKETDELAAERGGGYYLYQFADFVFNRAKADAAYLKNKHENYYSPNDLLELYETHKKNF